MDGTLVPESKDDFERLVIASPNSSFVWIQYMAFYLQSAEVETARNIAQRALRTIGFCEETVSIVDETILSNTTSSSSISTAVGQ